MVAPPAWPGPVVKGFDYVCVCRWMVPRSLPARRRPSRGNSTPASAHRPRGSGRTPWNNTSSSSEGVGGVLFRERGCVCVLFRVGKG